MKTTSLEELKNYYLGGRGNKIREIHELELVLDLVENHPEEKELIKEMLKVVINNLNDSL